MNIQHFVQGRIVFPGVVFLLVGGLGCGEGEGQGGGVDTAAQAIGGADAPAAGAPEVETASAGAPGTRPHRVPGDDEALSPWPIDGRG